MRRDQPFRNGCSRRAETRRVALHANATYCEPALTYFVTFLTHFDPSLHLVLACDFTAFGIRVVLAHKLLDGPELPIEYCSRSLSKAEHNYSQLEKEGLSCVFGVQRFHQYIFRHHFLLLTDHKPLLALLNEHCSTSAQASARIHRWSLELAAYEYTLKFCDTLSHSNADALSRLPLSVVPAENDPHQK